MGLTQALAASLSGLNATQAGLSVVAGNVANAQTPGYVTQRAVTQAITGVGGGGDSVRVAGINRILDQFVQTQLRTESSGGAYADLRAKLYGQLQQIYGQPGASASLDQMFNTFASSIQALSTTPGSSAVQIQAVYAAQAFAQQLNDATASIQQLRTAADQGIAGDVQQVNDALQRIAEINRQLVSANPTDGTIPSLQNQRDGYIDTLAKMMDIRVAQGQNNQVTIFTMSGVQLVGNEAARLDFTPTGTITANQQWNANPAQSGLGTISLIMPAGGTYDLVASGGIRSGELAAYINMRDHVLVQAQSQLDDFAARMSSALSDTTANGAPVTIGVQNGFDIDTSNILNGNVIHVTYTDALNVQHKVSIVRVDDPAALPLPNSATTDPNDTVVGVSFAGGTAAVATALNTALGATGLQFSATGSTLHVLDNGPATITVNNVSATTTATSLTSGAPALPMFLDVNAPYTGAFTGFGPETVGLAGRIQVNAALTADPSKLVAYAAATPSGDATRPNFIYDQLVNTTMQFSPVTGIGAVTAPFQGTLSGFLSQVVSTQGLAATAADNLQQGQAIVVNSLQARFNSTSAVNIDSEMADLLTLQNSYGANARVMSAVKEMLDTLMNM